MTKVIISWLISIIVLFVFCFILTSIFSDTDAAENALIAVLLLIAAKMFLAISDTVSAFVTYKLFGEQAVEKFSQAINKAGGLPTPDPVLFDLDNYLAEVRYSDDSSKSEIRIASEIVGMLDAYKNRGAIVSVVLLSKTIRKALFLNSVD